jgi:putative ABC transport system permease protein
MTQFGNLLQDLRLGFRLIGRAPLLNLAVILILVLGIAVNSIAFSLFNGLLFRANVGHDPASFVKLYAHRSGQSRPEPLEGVPTMMTLEEWVAIRTQSTTLSAVTASRWATFTVSSGEVTNLRGLFVSCDFLSTHVRRTLVGRSLEASDCATAGGAPVTVLGERAWNAFFDRDPGIVGRTLRVNNHGLTVVGVVPDSGVGDPDVRSMFVPYTMYAVLQGRDDIFRVAPDRYAWLNLSGRLAAGKSAADAQLEVRAILERLDGSHPGRKTGAVVTDGALIQERGLARVVVGLVLTATTLMLLLVCSNVTTLLLSRAEARRREMVIRMALGASDWSANCGSKVPFPRSPRPVSASRSRSTCPISWRRCWPASHSARSPRICVCWPIRWGLRSSRALSRRSLQLCRRCG